jgi:predicted nucleotidyltransferase
MAAADETLYQSLIDALRDVLKDGPALHLAVVFGSTARGRCHTGSDVDLGIIPVDPLLLLSDELGLQVMLENACRRPVDLVRLDRASLSLRWQVARDGYPIVGRDTGAWARFAAATASEHADIEPALRRFARRFQQRLVAAGAR